MGQIIVALDHPNDRTNVDLIEQLKEIEWFKVGIQTLFTEDKVDRIQSMGKKVFLDHKFYDTPDSIHGVISFWDMFGVDMATVHINCLEAAVAATKRMKIIGVGVLTSDIKHRTSYDMELSVIHSQCADGVVCPGSYAKYAKDMGLITVTPGVRIDPNDKDNHQFITDPEKAYFSDFLVVGRPIWESDNPVMEARKYIMAAK